jgi:CheY-like chemotaxis protein
MPGLSGINTLKRLLHIQPSLKIVMISAERDGENEQEAMQSGACGFLQKPFQSDDVDRLLHAAFGLRSPNLKVKASEPSFAVAIEGSTIRLAHKISGHVFEYLWCEKPPYLRNGVVRPAASCAIAPIEVAAVAEKAALFQLRSARLVAA